MIQPGRAESAEEVELAEQADEFEFLLRQCLIHAASHGLLYTAVEGLMTEAAEGMQPREAVTAVMEEMGLPRSVRIH